jgi:ATP-dependent DNA helicase RecQ
MPEPCGNCDTCLEKVETWDGTATAQKVLSCVYDTGQRFGAAYLTDVLLGKSVGRIRSFGHDNISAFGAGKELSANEWKSVFRQLVASGILSVDIDSKGGFSISSKGQSVMEGELEVALRHDPTPPKKTRTRRPSSSGRGSSQGKPKDTPEDVFVDQASVGLWEELREWRAGIARKKRVPTYAIFRDRTLRELVEQRPATLAALEGIWGIGQRKLDQYGQQILDLLKADAQ